MKKLGFVALLFCAVMLFASCSGNGGDKKETTAPQEENTTAVEDTTLEVETEAPPEEGMIRVGVYFNTVTDMAVGNEAPAADLGVWANIPDYMTKAEEVENCPKYVWREKKNSANMRGYEVVAAYKVKSDFVFDSSVGDTLFPTIDYTAYEVGEGTADSGLEYVTYKTESNRVFGVTVFVKTPEGYIYHLTYGDKLDNIEYLEKFLASISLEK